MSRVHVHLTFVETRVFTSRVVRLGLEEPLRQLQRALLENPAAGRVDPGTGGLRKIRMADPERRKGKRGGARVHYLWLPDAHIVYLMFVYTKDESESLTPAQRRSLKAVVDRIKATHAR